MLSEQTVCTCKDHARELCSCGAGALGCCVLTGGLIVGTALFMPTCLTVCALLCWPASCWTAVVPAGSYLKSPGVAALCPRGEYKSGLVDAGSCDRCAFGVTTAQEGSTSVGDCAGGM